MRIIVLSLAVAIFAMSPFTSVNAQSSSGRHTPAGAKVSSTPPLAKPALSSSDPFLLSVFFSARFHGWLSRLRFLRAFGAHADQRFCFISPLGTVSCVPVQLFQLNQSKV